MPSIGSKLDFNFENENFFYEVPTKEFAKYLEADWGYSLALSNLDAETYV